MNILKTQEAMKKYIKNINKKFCFRLYDRQINDINNYVQYDSNIIKDKDIEGFKTYFFDNMKDWIKIEVIY